jgi:hypothetical protein
LTFAPTVEVFRAGIIANLKGFRDVAYFVTVWASYDCPGFDLAHSAILRRRSWISVHMARSFSRVSQEPVPEMNTRGTVRDAYKEAYQNRTPVERQFVMNEEKIAILAEFYHHGIIAPSDLSPTTRAILDKIISGRNVRPEQRSRGGAVRFGHALQAL